MTQKVNGTSRPGEVMSGDIDFLSAYTLIDITDSGDSNPRGNSVTYRQSQNTNTLIQILSLRTQLVLSSVYKFENQNLDDYNFGTDYTGIATVWLLKFASEQQGAWAKDNDIVYWANADCNGVPVNTSLNETFENLNSFQTNSPNTINLYFTSSSSL